MTRAILREESDVGNPHVRFDEGKVASAKPRRVSLLYVKNFLMVATVVASLVASGATATVNGIKWTYTVSNGKASVGGGSSSSCAVPRTTTGAITIPSTLGGYSVTSIGNYAFYNCSGLTSVTIPSSVTSIGNYAFYICSGLTSVTIPSSVTSIGNYAFYGCSGLTSVTIPSSVTSIMGETFGSCVGLTSFVVDDANPSYCSINGLLCTKDGKTLIAGVNCEVTIPSSVTSIGNYAFEYRIGLTMVTIPSSVTSIGDLAFYGCRGLTSVTIPSSVTSIGDHAFSDCRGLTSVTIPSSVTSIEDYAFSRCSGLTSVTIPSSVTSIGDDAFSGCSGLTSVTIPSGVTNIGDDAFSDCTGLTGVLTIPEGVTSIGGYAFKGCSGLTSVTIPSGVTSIGEFAFCRCSGLTSVTIPASVMSIGRWAFADCAGLGEGIVCIDGCAVYTGILDLHERLGGTVVLPDGTRLIQDGLFVGSLELKSVTIPSSVTSIGEEAFSFCEELMSIEVSEKNEKYASADGVLYDKNLTMLLAFPGGKTSVEIPSTVTNVVPYAFEMCDRLSAVKLPAQLLPLDNLLHHGFSVSNVVVCDGATDICDGAFHGCYSLLSVTIPEGVTNIGNYAFEFCPNLTSVTIPSSVRSIGDFTFLDCSALKTVYVDSGDATRVKSLMSGSGFDVTDVSFVERASVVFHTVTFDLDEHGTRTGGGTLVQTVTNDCAAVAPEIKEDDWWRFVGWGPEDLVFEDALEARYWWEQVGQNGGWQVPLDGIKRDTTVRAIYRPLLPWQDDIQLSLAIDEEKSHFDCEEGRLQLYVTWSLSGADAPSALPEGTRVFIQEAETLRDWFVLEGRVPMGGANEIVFDVDARDVRKAYFRAVIDWPYGGDFVSDNIYAFDATFPDHIDYEYDGWWQEEGVLVVHPGETVKFTYDPEKVWEGEDMDWMYGCGYRIAVQEPWSGWPSTLGEFPWPENGVVYWTAPDELGEYYFTVLDDYDEEWLGGLWVRVEEAEASTHTVTFDLGEHGARTGGGALEQTVADGEAAVAPKVVSTNAWWRFYGWDRDFSSVTRDLSVKALWLPNETQFSISLKIVDGLPCVLWDEEGLRQWPSHTVKVYGRNAPDDMWRLVGSRLESCREFKAVVEFADGGEIESNAVSYHAVLFDFGEHGVNKDDGERECVQGVVTGEDAVAPEVEVDEGWRFTGWDRSTLNITESQTIRATYEPVASRFYSDWRLEVLRAGVALQWAPQYPVPYEYEIERAAYNPHPSWGNVIARGQADDVCDYVDFDVVEGESYVYRVRITYLEGGFRSETISLGKQTAYREFPGGGENVIVQNVMVQGRDSGGIELAWDEPSVGDEVAFYQVWSAWNPASGCALSESELLEQWRLFRETGLTNDALLAECTEPRWLDRFVPAFVMNRYFVVAVSKLDQISAPSEIVSCSWGEARPVVHTVAFDLGGHGTRTGGGELVQTVTNGCAAVAPEVVADAGWKFGGWDKDFGNVTADMTVTAQWKESVAIFETGWHGDGTNFWYGSKTNWVEKGVKCTISASSPVVDEVTRYVCTGYTMVSGGSEFEFSGTSLTTTPKAELEIYWNYEVDGYWFEATAGEHGRIECPAAGWVEPGSSVTIRSFPDEGYEFAGLSGDAEGCAVTNGVIVVPMDRGRRIRTAFTPNRPIAVIDSVSPDSPLSSDCIVFSGHGERGTITAYQWQCRRMDGGASSAAVRTIGFAQAGYVKLDAGGWRLEFFVQNDQDVWSLAATHDLTVGEVPLAPDLQILRSDIALRDAYGRRVDNVAVGETIDVSLAVRNVGDADVGGPVSVRLYEGILPVEALNGGSNAVVVAEASVSGVSAGRSSSVGMKWTVGKDAQGSDIAGYENGYRPYTVAVVSEDGTAEVTYVNNLASVMVALGDPGETVSELESRMVVPSSVYEGEMIRIEVTASYALSDGRGSIGSVAAVGAEITFSVDGDLRKTGSAPAPDGRYVLWIESLPVGEHEIAVTVGDGAMTKSFTGVVAVRTRPSEPPDEPGPSVGPGPEPAAVPRLAVRSLALTGDGIYSSSHPHYTATLGGRVGLRAKIVNEGTADFTNAVTATVRLVPSDGDAAEFVGQVIPNGLAAGESTWLEVGELDVVDVERDVRLTVLAGTAVSSPCTLHVRADRPNLVVEQFALSPSAAVWGDEIVATVRVANRGRADCTTPFTVDVAGAECEIPGLEAGEAATRTLTFAVADVLGEPGTCTVIARADASGEVDESDRSDNSRNCTLTVYADAAQPAPISLKAEPYPVPGVPSVLTAEIRNDGGQPYAGGTAKFFVGGSSGSLLGEGTVGALARFGGKGAATCLWTPNASGRVQVTVVIEGREYSTFFTVGNPPANLRVTEADISLEPGEPRAGDEVRFRAMVRNLSATTAATNAIVKFMVTDGSGAYDTLSVVPLAFLAPGDSAAVDAGAVYVARAGVHAVKVLVVDGSGKDADDRDNEAERSFGVGVPMAVVVPDDTSCIVGDAVVLDGRASTGAEDFVWTVEEAPAGVIARIADDHSPVATFVPPMAGVYRLALTVSCDGVTGEKAYVTVNADRVRIVAAAQGGGRIEPAGEAVYLAGEMPRYRFVHENGYRLDRVDVDGATVMGVGGDYEFAPLAGNHEIEAVFVRQEAEIDGEEYGKWHVGDVYERVIETPVDLGGGTQLVCRGWSVWHSNVTDVIASSTDDTIRFKIGDVGPYGVVVDWTTNYWLTVIAPTNGSVVGATNGWHAASEKFSLTAVADEDYEFVRWTGDVPDKDEEENPLTLEMTGVKCVGATFARVPIDIPRAVNAEGIEWCTSGDAEWFGEWNDCAADGLHDARSGRISDGGESILSAKVFGKGTLSFVWKSSTEAKYDAVRLEVDSVIIRQLSGKTDWQPISVDLQSGGEHIIRWIFSKNRSISEGVDAVWIDEVRWNGVGEPLPTEVSLAEALNFGCDLTWTSGGDAAWEAVRSEFSYEGDACAISGCIGDGEGSWIQTTVNGAGLVEFAWAVSSEEGYDWVEFIVDGETVRMATGETGWQSPSYVLDEGEHTLRWEYWKDEIDLDDVGGDCAVLDYVRWTPKPDAVDPRFAKVDVGEFFDWLRKYRQIGDVEQPVNAAEMKVMAVAKADVVGMKDMTLLEEYIAGTDPTDPKSKFTAKIEMGADGQPVVTWDPPLNGKNDDGTCIKEGVRTYTVMGSDVLSNDPKDWIPWKEGQKTDHKYFKVTVGMP